MSVTKHGKPPEGPRNAAPYSSVLTMADLQNRAARTSEMERQNDILERKMSAMAMEITQLKAFILDQGMTYAGKY